MSALPIQLKKLASLSSVDRIPLGAILYGTAYLNIKKVNIQYFDFKSLFSIQKIPSIFKEKSIEEACSI